MDTNNTEEKKIRVMVIEDEEMLLSAIVRKLEGKGMKSDAFSKASKALEFLAEGSNQPDIIWLDYYLDDIDGLEFMKRLRANEQWVDIPVVVVSNSASEEKKNLMSELGVSEYILKSEHRLEDIVEILVSVIKSKRN
jgi:two-component system, OmpR family, phosphate regulon response regulator PhoB